MKIHTLCVFIKLLGDRMGYAMCMRWSTVPHPTKVQCQDFFWVAKIIQVRSFPVNGEYPFLKAVVAAAKD
jgi:hypothetical protein